MLTRKSRVASGNKDLRRQAEVAAEWYLREILHCVHVRRAVRSKWHKVDFFGADLVGKVDSGAHVYAQVTTGGSSCVSVRRKELAGFPWHESDIVLLLNLVATESPAKGRRKEYWFRFEEFELTGAGRKWQDWESVVPVPPEWFHRWHN